MKAIKEFQRNLQETNLDLILISWNNPRRPKLLMVALKKDILEIERKRLNLTVQFAKRSSIKTL